MNDHRLAVRLLAGVAIMVLAGGCTAGSGPQHGADITESVGCGCNPEHRPPRHHDTGAHAERRRDQRPCL